ncbi:hypothetical protein [Nocardioides sp. Root151]|uniref:hypothetical protein n=1 Tax=Nocardioides sp. Root151 TaxID=1736475 RepID=UPI00070248FD|nr:hypothetical protein [Nocardioides sp. Root151]KQZ69788.1 hypothetical protein ASD66_08720 [Nocardioides sp. Root151]
MADQADRADVAAVEDWFVANGLPYFVDGIREDVGRRMRPSRLLAVLVVGVVLAVPVGLAVGLWADQVSYGVSSALTTLAGVFGLYGLLTLKAWLWIRWAAGQTLGSLSLMVPLVTRALPLLLLFITFLFINAEVWQVGATLDGGIMWAAVMLFAAIAVGFLLSRLPEELDAFDRDFDITRLSSACRGTPLETEANRLRETHTQLPVPPEVTGLQKANLVLVLLVAQIVQVLLLSLSVFAFFILFGVVAMDDAVIETWVGHSPETFLGPVSRELVQVSVFLAAFSGLYFAVYAVTDELYRKQFFTSITRELERAVSARVVYRSMRRG